MKLLICCSFNILKKINGCCSEYSTTRLRVEFIKQSKWDYILDFIKNNSFVIIKRLSQKSFVNEYHKYYEQVKVNFKDSDL